jgi:hypothetical protein
MVRRRGPRLTAPQRAELWRRWREGESLNAIGRALGRISKMVHYVVAGAGGIPPGGSRGSRHLSDEPSENVSFRSSGDDESLAACRGRWRRASVGRVFLTASIMDESRFLSQGLRSCMGDVHGETTQRTGSQTHLHHTHWCVQANAHASIPRRGTD